MYRLKQLTILIIDLLVLYVGFFITLLVRHGIETNHESFTGLLPHISILYFIAIVLLFIIGLYDLTNNKNTFTFYRKLSSVAVLWAIMSVIYFYLNPAVAVTPKTILLLNTLIGFSLLALWRYLHNRFLSIS
jgi:uncharacterized membrane protein